MRPYRHPRHDPAGLLVGLAIAVVMALLAWLLDGAGR